MATVAKQSVFWWWTLIWINKLNISRKYTTNPQTRITTLLVVIYPHSKDKSNNLQIKCLRYWVLITVNLWPCLWELSVQLEFSRARVILFYFHNGKQTSEDRLCRRWKDGSGSSERVYFSRRVNIKTKSVLIY